MSLLEASPSRAAIRQPCGRGTAGTAANDHPMILHARMNGITIVPRNRYFGIRAQYCFRHPSLGSNLAGYLYTESLFFSAYNNDWLQ